MRNRDYYFDNGKFILILFVVFGHLLRSFIHENHFVFSLYMLIYTFHMPGFILIAGYFAKGYVKKGYIKKIAKKLILPYFLFQIIYSIFYFHLYHENSMTINPFDPHWSLWFLLSLFFWNLFLYLFTKINKYMAFCTAVVLGIVVGYIHDVNGYLSLSRTFVFFPIFLLGFYLRKEHFTIIRKTIIKRSSIIVLAIVWLGFFIMPEIDFNWLQGSKSYASLGHPDLKSGFIRLGLYTIMLMSTFGFLSLIPTKEHFFTKWGARTLYVYLLHGFLIQSFRNSGLMNYLQDPGITILLIIGATLITLLLSSKIIKVIAQPLVEAKTTEIKKVIHHLLNSNLKEQEN